jgi:amino acid transporter
MWGDSSSPGILKSLICIYTEDDWLRENLEKKGIFVRESSGLVREMGAFEAFSISAGTVNPTIWAVSAFVGFLIFVAPGASIPKALTFGFLMILLTAIVYSLFGIVVPRTGGEYVTVGRAIHPAVGFTASWVLWIFVMLTLSTCMTFVQWTLCTAPFLAMMGHRLHNATLLSWAASLSNPNVVFALAFPTILITGLIVAFGRKWVTRAFIFLWIFMIAGVIVQAYLLMTSTPETFKAAFSSYVGGVTSVDEIMKTAIQNGWDPNTYKMPEWTASIAGIGVCMFLFNGFGYAVDCAGEIKSVRRNLPIAIAIGLVIVFLVDLVGMSLAPMGIGYDFIYASQYVSSLGLWTLPSPPFVTYFAGALTDNIVLTFIMGFSLFIANFMPDIGMWYVLTRLIFAWSFDRVIPASFADVNPRFHTPTKAIIATGIITVAGSALVEYTPYAYAMLNTAAGTATVWLLAAIAAAVIPFRLKDTYEKSAGRFNIGKIPIMTILAVIDVPFLAWAIYTAMSTPAIGATGPLAVAILAGAFLSGFIVYYVSRTIRKSQGIDLDLAFKEIPPV